MKEYDIIRAAVAADMPDLEKVRRDCMAGNGKRTYHMWMKWASGAAAALVLAAGIFIASQRMPKPDALVNETSDVGNTANADVNGQTQTTAPSNIVDIHINNGGSSQMTDIAAIWKNVEKDKLPKEFSSIINVKIPEGFCLGDLGCYYLPDVVNGEVIPGTLYDYSATYLPISEGSENGGERYVTIAMSYIGKPIQGHCWRVETYDETSHIGDTEIMIYGYDQYYSVQFQYDGAYFDVDAMGLTETELVDVLCSIVK